MKICILTNELTEKHGYGRYSMDLIGALKNKGIEVVVAEDLPSSLSYKKNYFLAFWYALRLRKQTKDCDIVHSFVEPYSYIAYWLSKLTGKKYFITTHGTFGVLPYHFPAYRKYFHKKSFENAEKIICVSNYTRRCMEKFGLNNLTVIHNGINYDKFYQSHGEHLGKEENFILSVGVLKYRKGYHISIPAFAKVLVKFKDLKYYIVGDQSNDSYFNHLKRIASELSVRDNIRFFNSIPDSELIDLYKKAKLFILTPVSENYNFEGFGLVYLEASACGLPVIGSLDSGAEDAIKSEETGLLVPQGELEATSEAMLKILENNNLARKLGGNGVIWAKDHDWSHIVKDYIRLYRAI